MQRGVLVSTVWPWAAVGLLVLCADRGVKGRSLAVAASGGSLASNPEVVAYNVVCGRGLLLLVNQCGCGSACFPGNHAEPFQDSGNGCRATNATFTKQSRALAAPLWQCKQLLHENILAPSGYHMDGHARRSMMHACIRTCTSAAPCMGTGEPHVARTQRA